MRLIRPVESSRLGFTLIELMVVIVLAGIMAAAIIPEMRGTYEDALLRAAGRELVEVFSIAGSRAASLNEAHRVRLERNSGRYWIERKSSDGESPSGFVRVHDVPGSEGKIDSRISIEFKSAGDESEETLEASASAPPERDTRIAATVQAVTFYADGTADNAEILLQDRDGFRRVLRVNSTTARVQIGELGRRGAP